MEYKHIYIASELPFWIACLTGFIVSIAWRRRDPKTARYTFVASILLLTNFLLAFFRPSLMSLYFGEEGDISLTIIVVWLFIQNSFAGSAILLLFLSAFRGRSPQPTQSPTTN
jgi:hypothetical protein